MKPSRLSFAQGVSENDDHHSGKIAMLSMYIATDKFVTVGVVWKSSVT